MKHSVLFLLSIFMSMPLFAGIKPFYRFDFNNPQASQPQKIQMRASASTSLLPDSPMRVGTLKSASLKCTGSPKIPVVLVQFSDKHFTVASADKIVDFYDKYCNGTKDGILYTGANSYGSIRDYFYEQSDGLFAPEFQIIGPITLSKAYSYYGKNSTKEIDVNISDFFNDAIKKTSDLGVNWSNFDNNSDGKVDMCFFIYAGRGENDSSERDVNAIWPKEQNSTQTINRVTYAAYGCCNELMGTNVDGIGVMCHELSHALGLPDLYDVKYVNFGLDYWDLMDSGNYCKSGYHPCGYSAYERAFMNWRPLITLKAGQGQSITIYPMSDSRGRGYKIVNPQNSNEYYIVENRQPEGWDKYLGYGTPTYGFRSGLLITHVDYDETAWTKNCINIDSKHQRLTIIPADGALISYMGIKTEEQQMEYLNSMAGDMFPGAQNVTSFEGAQQVVYSGTSMNQPITNIVQHLDGSITFDFCGGAPNDIQKTPICKVNKPKLGFDISGKLVNIDENQLKQGIYIINGKKVLVK